MTNHTANEKILGLDDLADRVRQLRGEGKRVVHCHGVFDLLHIGHIRHLESARSFGDVLVVTVTPNEWVNKGPERPAFDVQYRAEALANLATVDFVAINRWPTAIETIKLLKPNYFAKGSEFADMSSDVTGAVRLEADAVKEVGGEMAFTKDVIFSSSNLINRYMSSLTNEAQGFISSLAERYRADDVIAYLESARSIRVLTIGETIIDEYHFCETLGAAGKEPILAVRLESQESFPGGILAVANHAASFCDRVGLVSCLGKQDTREDFVRAGLKKNVVPQFLMLPGAPTIVKRRYIESYPFQKLFEVYFMDDQPPDAVSSKQLCEILEKTIPQYDVVIVNDYGHGMLGADAIGVITRNAGCLAVNVQANAGNRGFNTISRYEKADFICISEKELRLEARERRRDLRQVIEKVVSRVNCPRILITQGGEGMLHYDRDAGFLSSPALVGHFADRVGAGDAVHAISSLLMYQEAPAEILTFVANAVGAMAVGIVGNRSAIDRTQLTRFIISLFK